MNIHLPAILMFTRGTRFWHTAIYMIPTSAMNRSRNRAGTDEMASLIQEDETMSPCFEGMTSTEAPDVDREVGPMWSKDGTKMGIGRWEKSAGNDGTFLLVTWFGNHILNLEKSGTWWIPTYFWGAFWCPYFWGLDLGTHWSIILRQLHQDLRIIFHISKTSSLFTVMMFSLYDFTYVLYIIIHYLMFKSTVLWTLNS